jgi:hypothetical protein
MLGCLSPGRLLIDCSPCCSCAFPVLIAHLVLRPVFSTAQAADFANESDRRTAARGIVDGFIVYDAPEVRIQNTLCLRLCGLFAPALR